MELAEFWFILIAVLWTGYLVLEGFDFGVGMLMPIIGRSNKGRRVVLNTIGPCGTATRCGFSPPAVPRSRRSPSGTPPCSPASTCRCC